MAAYKWTGSANDGNYSNPANWSPNGVPGPSDSVVISPSVASSINASNASAGSLKTTAKVTMSVNNNSRFTFGAGTGKSKFTNDGTFALGASNASLLIDDNRLTLAGAGTVMLGGGGASIVGATAKDVFDNKSNLIEGGGQLGAGQLTFMNGAEGVVDANIADQLVLNTGTIAIKNAGQLEATSGGGLVIESSVNDAAKGMISAAGANVFIDNGATISGGTLTSSGGATVQASGAVTLNGVTNAGQLSLADSGTLSLRGTITNSGTISENTISNHNSTIAIGPSAGKVGTASLTGGGLLLLDNNTGNLIVAAKAGDTLNNVNNIIEGAGQIGGGGLHFSNAAGGVVNAALGAELVLNAGSIAMSNAGLFEATSGGSLVIQSDVNNAATGTLAAAGGNIYIQNGATISGGTVTSSGGAMVQASGAATLSSLTNTGLLALADSGTFSLLGNITNSGTITENTVSNHASTLLVGPTSGNTGTMLLTGGGMLLLSDNGGNMILAGQAGDTLNNKNNIIEGTGQLGLGNLNLINGGTIGGSETGILAIDVTTLSNSGTILAGGTGGTSVTGSISNTGLFEALAGSTLTLAGQFTNAANGKITASGGSVNLAGVDISNFGVIDLATSPQISITGTIDNGTTGKFFASAALLDLNGGSLNGGTIANSAGGSIVIGGAETFNGLAQSVTNQGWVNATGQTLTLLGTITNQGTLSLDNYTGFPHASEMVIDSPTVTLNGFGTLTLEDAYNDQILGVAAGDIFDNVNNTIMGSGQITGTMSMINGASGIIDAATANGYGSNGLTIDLTGTLTNQGLIEATSATLYLDSTIENRGHVILAAGADIWLTGGTIEGGTLESSGTGSLVVVNVNGTLDGSAQSVTNSGSILVVGQTLSLLGTLSNGGIVNLYNTAGYPRTSGLQINSSELVLNGGGTIVLEDRGNDFIDGASGGDHVLDNVDNLIQGSGTLGGMDIINGAKGIIEASSAHGNGTDGMIINVIDHTLTNDGLIETSGVTLTIYGTVTQGSGGVFLAASGTVNLMGSVIEGGTIEASGGGSFVSASGNNVFDGSASPVTLMSTIDVVSGTSLTLLGSIVNDNQIDLLAYTSAADLIIASPTLTLSGGGTISLDDNSANMIFGTTISTQLDNQTNTIEGSGQLGDGTLTLVNGGTISATGNTSLVIDLSGAGTNTASGQMLGAGAGGLLIQAGAITNNGLIAVEDNSRVVFSGTASLTNDSAFGTLAGGSYAALAGADGATLSVTGAAVVTDLADITLQGAGSAIQFGGVSLDSSLDAIGTTGTLTLLSGRAFDATANGGSFTTNGALNLDDASFTATVLTISAGGELSGAGMVQGSVVDSGAIVASGGTVALAGAVSGAGMLLAGAGDTISLGAGGSLSETIGGAGAVELASGGWTLATAVTGSNSGTLQVDASASLSGAGTLAGAVANGGLIANGGGALSFIGAVSNGGTIDAAGGAILFKATVAGAGTLEIGAAATLSLLAGASAGQTVDFLSAGGVLDLTDPISFLGTIAGFGSATEIDLVNTPETGYAYNAGVLTLTDNGTTVARLDFTGSYTQADFSVGKDHHGGTVITFV